MVFSFYDCIVVHRWKVKDWWKYFCHDNTNCNVQDRIEISSSPCMLNCSYAMWVFFIPNVNFETACIVKVVLSFHNPLRMPNIKHFDAVDTIKFSPTGLALRSKCCWNTSILNMFISSGLCQKKHMCVWGGECKKLVSASLVIQHIVVSKVKILRARQSKIWILAGEGDLSLLNNQIFSEAHSPSCSLVTGGAFPQG
jgi:hypothetical protein